MSDFQPIDGNPSETVGATRIVEAKESEEMLRLWFSPRRLIDVLRDHLHSTHVLIAFLGGFTLQAIFAMLADSMFPRADLTWVFIGLSVAILVVCSVLYFAIVHGDDAEQAENESPITLTIDPEHFEVTLEGWGGERTPLEGEAWELVETLNRLVRSRIGPSTQLMAALRPTSSLRSLLVAGLTEEDRNWLSRQFETEA